MKYLDYSAVSTYLPTSILTALGRVAAHWGFLETEFDVMVAALVVHPDFEQERYLQIPFKSRLSLARRAAAKIHQPEQAKELGRVLDRIANARGKRDPLMHGRIEVAGDRQSIYVENHYHTNRDGSWRVRRKPYSVRKIDGAAQTILNAANALVAFNRKHGLSLPATWLDVQWTADQPVIRPFQSVEHMPLFQPRPPLK